MTDTKTLLLQGIAAAKAGDRQQAHHLLTQVIQQDMVNKPAETAWLWLSTVYDDSENKRQCLETVLRLNPNHTHANKGLEKLQKQAAKNSLVTTQTITLSPSSNQDTASQVDITATKPPKKIQTNRPDLTAEEITTVLRQTFPQYNYKIPSMNKNKIALKRGSFIHIGLNIKGGDIRPTSPLMGIGAFILLIILSVPLLIIGPILAFVIMQAYYSSNLKKHENEIMLFLQEIYR